MEQTHLRRPQKRTAESQTPSQRRHATWPCERSCPSPVPSVTLSITRSPFLLLKSDKEFKMCKARLRREQFMDTRCSGPCSSGGEENYFLREEESRTGSGPPRPTLSLEPRARGSQGRDSRLRGACVHARGWEALPGNSLTQDSSVSFFGFSTQTMMPPANGSSCTFSPRLTSPFRSRVTPARCHAKPPR